MEKKLEEILKKRSIELLKKAKEVSLETINGFDQSQIFGYAVTPESYQESEVVEITSKDVFEVQEAIGYKPEDPSALSFQTGFHEGHYMAVLSFPKILSQSTVVDKQRGSYRHFGILSVTDKEVDLSKEEFKDYLKFTGSQGSFDYLMESLDMIEERIDQKRIPKLEGRMESIAIYEPK